MNKERGEEAVKIEISEAESKSPIEEKNGAEKEVAKEKPLNEMSKTELLQKIKEVVEKSEGNYDLYLRSQAEIDNILKRNKKDKEEWVKYSNETLIKELLPVMDNLEKALSHSKDKNSLDALREGVDLTLKGLKDTLYKSGLEEVKAEGEPFDPCFHHAVSEQDDGNVEAGFILDELQRGYTLNKRLIRPAMVVLSKGKPGKEKRYKETDPDRVCEK